MARQKGQATMVFLFALVVTAPLFAQHGQAGACAQIRQACEAAGFTFQGGRGSGLRMDCVEPILAGQTRSPGGRSLPSVDPNVVAECSGRPPDTSASGAGAPPSQPPSGVGGNPRNSDGLMMSEPRALFTGTTLGLNAMPDQQTPVLREPGGNYRLYITGVRPGQPGGVVSVFNASDLTQASSYRNEGMILWPPKQKNATGNCDGGRTDVCAIYIGMASVFETDTPHGLVGFYIADQKNFANGSCGKGAFYGQLGVATTLDGKKWTPHGPILRGARMPEDCTRSTGPIAFNQPTAIKIGSYYYVYFALPVSGKRGIAVARAPIRPGGMPGSWSVLYQGQWTDVRPVDDVPTIQDLDMVVPTTAYTTMPWISYNTYLQTYLLTFVTTEAFYYSKLEKSGSGQPSQADIDAQKWTAPELFVQVPGGQNWQKCQVTWENLSFVTPGTGDNHVTGKDGYAILSVVPAWSCGTRGQRSFSIASYAFGVTTPPAPPIGSAPHQSPRRD